MFSIVCGLYRGLSSATRSTRGALHTASVLRCKAEATTTDEKSLEATEGDGDGNQISSAPDPKDRTNNIPVETSIRYLKSAAYKQTYGEDFVWTQYR